MRLELSHFGLFVNIDRDGHRTAEDDIEVLACFTLIENGVTRTVRCKPHVLHDI